MKPKPLPGVAASPKPMSDLERYKEMIRAAFPAASTNVWHTTVVEREQQPQWVTIESLTKEIAILRDALMSLPGGQEAYQASRGFHLVSEIEVDK